VVCFFTAYLAMVFLDRNPILPASEGTRQYLDLAYQLSLAGEAKNHFPIDLPQVAGEPLYYHWFGYAHMAMASLIGHIDLPVVTLRLAIPALCAATIVLTAVVGWRVTGRPYAGAVAAALFFTIGEVNFTNPVTMPFGTQATFVIWHGMSMIYSWVLLVAVMAPLAEIAGRRARFDGWLPPLTVPPIGGGAFVLAALLLFGSSGAKASSLPVVGIALAFTAIVLFVVYRTIAWGLVLAGLITAAAQVFAMAVLYHFQSYGLDIGPLSGLKPYWNGAGTGWNHVVIVAAVWLAFVVNMLLRTAGIVPLLWLTRGRLEPSQWFLLGGALAGPGLYLLLSQPGSGNQYFTRAGFAFAVLLSAWGYVMVVERADLSPRALAALGLGAAAFASALVVVQLRYALPAEGDQPYRPIMPIVWWAGLLAVVLVAGGVVWWVASHPWPELWHRYGVVALTVILVAGTPGLVMDEYKSIHSPNGGAYVNITMPRSRVQAARFVRDHSQPDEVVATNAHCIGMWGTLCDSRSFWLSAYSERRVLVEGWGFSPRLAKVGLVPFWDPQKLAVNDQAFSDPDEATIAALRGYGVRWLVVDRGVGAESASLKSFATQRFDNGRLAVYEVLPA
jgi:hypothetical protein